MMNSKRALSVVPGLIIGVASTGAGGSVVDRVDSKKVDGYDLGSRIDTVRKHFDSVDHVELKENGALLSWYNFNNGFDNFDNGYGR